MSGKIPIGEGTQLPSNHEPGSPAEESLDFKIAAGGLGHTAPIGEGGSFSPVPEDYDGDYLTNEGEFPASTDFGEG